MGIINANARFAEQAQIVPAVMPIDLNGQANNGDWVSLKNFERLTVLVVASVGSAGSDLTMTLNQATSVAGAGSKVLNVIERIATKQAVALNAVAAWTDVTQTADEQYTDTDNGEQQLVYAVDILPEELDVANSFDCVQCVLSQPGAAKIGCALYMLWPAKYPSHPDDQRGAIAD